MKRYLVTVKLPKNPAHDGRNKKAGKCPVFVGKDCTDVTGQHHTGLEETNESLAEVMERYQLVYHVARVEEA